MFRPLCVHNRFTNTICLYRLGMASFGHMDELLEDPNYLAELLPPPFNSITKASL